MREIDTELFVKEAKQGNKEALVKLIMHKKEDYYKLAYTYMGNEHDALDALENMIVILFEKITQLKKDKSFYSWSCSILVNCCKSILRQNKNIVQIRDEIHISDNYSDKDRKIVIEQCLYKLNIKYREVIKMRYYLDYEYKKISKLLGIPLGTVKSRINKGIKKLRDNLGDDFNEY
ncbi:MAG: RNA polymerase sigma factor [Eubacteriaceae bacterium]